MVIATFVLSETVFLLLASFVPYMALFIHNANSDEKQQASHVNLRCETKFQRGNENNVASELQEKWKWCPS